MAMAACIRLIAVATLALLPGVSSLIFHSEAWSRALAIKGPRRNEHEHPAATVYSSTGPRDAEQEHLSTVQNLVAGNDTILEDKMRYLTGRKAWPFAPFKHSRHHARVGNITSFCMNGHVAPSLFVLGAPKSGTTSLSSMLQHPQFQFPEEGWSSYRKPIKELHYFDAHFSKNRMHWLSHYPDCPREADLPIVATDMTPNYFCDVDVPQRISDTYGASKGHINFVILLRRPIDRMHSAFYHGGEYGFPSEAAKQLKVNWGLSDAGYGSFSDYANALIDWNKNVSNWKAGRFLDETKYGGCDTFRASLYLEQLQRYFEHFQAKQFTIIPSSFIFKPKASDASIPDHLLSVVGLPPQSLNSGDVPTLNVGHHQPIEKDLDAKTLWQLNKVFDELGGSSQIAAFLAKHPGANLMGYNGGSCDKSAIARWLEARW
jgi:hypothetical protein